MKTKINVSVLIVIVLGTIGITLSTLSCKKDKKIICEASKDQHTRTQRIKSGSPPAIGRYVTGDAGTVTILGVSEATVDYVLSAYSLSMNGGDNPIGLALLYSGAIDTLSLTASTPAAIFVYKENGGRLWIQLYRAGAMGWTEDDNCWGITTHVGYNQIGKQIEMEELEFDNLVFLESSSFPATQYLSDWEAIPVDTSDHTSGARPCVYNGACHTGSKGTCDPVSPGGGGGDVCNTGDNKDPSSCPATSALRVLSNNSYTANANVELNLYTVRDLVLRASKHRTLCIDDYYYCGYVLADAMDLTLALKAFDVFQSNLPRKLAHMDDSNYADTVIITSAEKTILLNLCSEAENYSADERYQTVLDSVVVNVNRYYNKSGSYMHAHF